MTERDEKNTAVSSSGLHLFDLTGRNAVVIGGTSGIGRVAALALASAGANVIPAGRREKEATAVSEEIRSIGRESIGISADVQQRKSLQLLLEKAQDQLGPIDILVNAAGISKRTSTLDVSEGEWQQIIDVNLNGMFRACQTFARPMTERRYGRIINIASLTSFVAFQEVAAYGASKGGVASLTKSLAIEFAHAGVMVNAVAPGVFPTSLNSAILNGTPRGREILMRTPMQRFGRVEELSGVITFLASEAASYITGTVLTVDGGYLASGVNQ